MFFRKNVVFLSKQPVRMVISLKRKAIQSLIEWKNSLDRKPLVLKGARQVGKTWLMKEFGKTH